MRNRNIMNLNKMDFIKKYEISLILALFFIVAGVHNYIQPPGSGGDTYGYVETLQVLNGGTPSEDFVPLRILSTYLSMHTISFLTIFTGDMWSAWAFMNMLFFAIGNTLFYLFAKDVFRDSSVALFTTFLVALNYAIIIFGLTYVVDMPSWAFYMASLWAIFRYLNNASKKYFWLIIGLISVGFL